MRNKMKTTSFTKMLVLLIVLVTASLAVLPTVALGDKYKIEVTLIDDGNFLVSARPASGENWDPASMLDGGTKVTIDAQTVIGGIRYFRLSDDEGPTFYPGIPERWIPSGIVTQESFRLVDFHQLTLIDRTKISTKSSWYIYRWAWKPVTVTLEYDKELGLREAINGVETDGDQLGYAVQTIVQIPNDRQDIVIKPEDVEEFCTYQFDNSSYQITITESATLSGGSKIRVSEGNCVLYTQGSSVVLEIVEITYSTESAYSP